MRHSTALLSLSMLLRRLVMVIGLCVAGCSGPERDDNPVSPEVYRRWHDVNSYYALIEIMDAHLANRPNYKRATKGDVLSHLGKPNWGTGNQDAKKEWAYQGLDRHVPYGDKVIFTFNEKDELIDIGWVSE